MGRKLKIFQFIFTFLVLALSRLGIRINDDIEKARKNYKTVFQPNPNGMSAKEFLDPADEIHSKLIEKSKTLNDSKTNY